MSAHDQLVYGALVLGFVIGLTLRPLIAPTHCRRKHAEEDR